MIDYETMDPFELRDALHDLDGEQEDVVYEGHIHSSCENYLAGRELLIPEENVSAFISKAISLAYETHHSYGYGEILNELPSYLDLVIA